jgi:hypothetical protein
MSTESRNQRFGPHVPRAAGVGGRNYRDRFAFIETRLRKNSRGKKEERTESRDA